MGKNKDFKGKKYKLFLCVMRLEKNLQDENSYHIHFIMLEF